MSIMPGVVEANLSLEGIGLHDHIALFYASDNERDRQSAKLIISAFNRGEHCAILCSPETVAGLDRQIKDLGMNMDDLMVNGCLRFIFLDRDHPHSVQDQLDLLDSIIEEGLCNGYHAVRVLTYASALMPWFDRNELMRLESLSNELFEELKAIGICLWREEDPNIMLAVATHPYLIVRGFLCRNYFYIGPQEIARECQAFPRGPAFLERLLEIQMNELSLSSKDDLLSELNHRLADEIEQRQMVEWALIQSENNLRNALNAMADMVHVIDREGKVVLANRVFLDRVRDMGYQGEVVGEDISKILHFFSTDGMADYQRVFITGRPVMREERMDIDGRTIFLEVRKIPVMNGPSAHNVLTITREIGDRKEVERNLTCLNAEL